MKDRTYLERAEMKQKKQSFKPEPLKNINGSGSNIGRWAGIEFNRL